MKYLYLSLLLLPLVSTLSHGQIVDIPDVNFKDALVNSLCVDTNNDGILDGDVDINNDGEIQVSEAEAVVYLDVHDKNIISMEGISAFSNLEVLYCWKNSIAVLDISQNIQLRELYCFLNILHEIDLTQNSELEILNIALNNLVEIEVSNNSNLQSINISSNYISQLNISENIDLIEFFASINSITSVDFSENEHLESVNLSLNQLTEIDLSNNVNLLYLNLNSNTLNELDLTANTLLEDIRLGNLDIESIDLSQNTNLVSFYGGQSDFNTIDFSQNLNLDFVNVWGCNNLLELDFSQNTHLTEVHCYFMGALKGLNIKNGNNTAIADVSAFGNSFLDCIEVDDPEYAYNNEAWSKDDDTLYSEDCESLGVLEFMNAGIELYPNPARNIVFLETPAYKIDAVVVYDLQGRDSKIDFDQSGNKIDVSALAKGVYFLKVYSEDQMAVKRFVKE